VRAYLAEFLSDPRVVELPRLVWLPILHGIVLRTRPAKSAAKYAKIWSAGGSPLAVHTRLQAELLQQRCPELRVGWAMRYGEPGIAAGLNSLSGCDAITVVPLYPQYSRSTTASVKDLLPANVKMIESFHDHPDYVGALAALVKRHWNSHGRGDNLLMSFHGLPRRSVERGDPYERQCRATADLLARALGLADGEWRVSFQSRFGAAEWLQPYTEPALVELARAGRRRVDVLCPGFVADCLETLEEIGIEGRQAFLAAGGETFHALPCLNESPEWIAALERISHGGP
jgi:ferrochelatase